MYNSLVIPWRYTCARCKLLKRTNEEALLEGSSCHTGFKSFPAGFKLSRSELEFCERRPALRCFVEFTTEIVCLGTEFLCTLNVTDSCPPVLGARLR
jgi:hypothetical protein